MKMNLQWESSAQGQAAGTEDRTWKSRAGIPPLGKPWEGTIGLYGVTGQYLLVKSRAFHFRGVSFHPDAKGGECGTNVFGNERRVRLT
jgi:hypothetical protein